MSLRRNQMLGVIGAAAATLVIFLVWANASAIATAVRLPPDDPESRLIFLARWMLVPGLTLLAGIFGAARRGFYADAIEGTRTPASRSLEINLRYNTNTVEQTVLAAIAWAGLSQTLPRDELFVIPTMALLFAVGRITFWVGYALHPMARAFGMTLTALPTIYAFGFLVWNALAPMETIP